MAEFSDDMGRRDFSAFPPYRLVERDYLREAQEKYWRLERLYRVAQKKTWDGPAVLRGLIEQHGGIRLDPELRRAIGSIFSVILWGELAAWHVSADIAEALTDVEAKMAATSQAFDEARHFHTMRAYLMELGMDLPELDAYTRAVLIAILESDSLIQKLVGMQLLVENVALHLFRGVAQAGIEPVLAGLMPYFERDEARHVGLGVLYLPTVLPQLGLADMLRLQAFQIKVTTLVVWATLLLRRDFEALGIDLHATFRAGLRNQLEIFESMGRYEGATRGIYIPPPLVLRANEYAIDLFFPPADLDKPGWMKAAHGVLGGVARLGERVLEWSAP